MARGLMGRARPRAQMVTTRPVVLFMKGTPDQPKCGFSLKTVCPAADAPGGAARR